jgi:iron(III) transport system substrate-binding protein
MNARLFLLLVLGGSLLLAACGSAAPAAPSAVPTPSVTTITVYTAFEEETLAAYVPLFEKSHPGIKLAIVRGSTGEITEKFLAEKSNPQADVVWGVAASSLLLAAKQDLLAPYAPVGLERVEPQFRDAANPPSWVGIDVWESAFCANETELKKRNLPIPSSWADLIKPIYKDAIVMPDPAASGTGYMSVVGLIQLMGEDKAWDYFDALNENIVEYVSSGSKPCVMAGQGAVPIGISFGYRAIIEKGEVPALVPVWPAEGSGWDVEANALVKKAAINPLAKTFLDWAISDVIVKEYAKNYPITSVKSGLPLPEGYLSDPVRQLLKNDLNFAANERSRILQTWQERYQKKR